MMDNEDPSRRPAAFEGPEPGPHDESLPDTCPSCGLATVVPIVYGYPAGELRRASAEGRVVLGGCLVFDAAPHWQCTNCGATEGTGGDAT